MRRLFIPLSAILFLATFGSLSPAIAARYCLQGGNWGFPGNCQFSSLRECQATASGTNASCGRSPRYAYARQRGTQPTVNNGWNNNGWNNNWNNSYGWNNSGWNNPGVNNPR